MKIWVNGCFDILHTGHLDLLEYAKNLGDGHNELIVGIDSDRRVNEFKDENRPINNQADRKRLLESLCFIDIVYIFDTSDELRNLIEHNNIDIMIVGDEYRNKEVIGEERSRHGVLYYKIDDRSTTQIIDRIKNI